MVEELEREPWLYCQFCGRWLSWQEFSFGTWNEATPLVCIDCLRKGKIERTFIIKREEKK